MKNTKITEENKDKIFETIKDSRDLTVEEVQLLQGYLLRRTLAGAFSGKGAGLPTGKTIGELIEEQRKYISDEKAREEAEQVREGKSAG